MKAIEIIERVDALEPNQYNAAQKLDWLSQLDGQIFHELGSAVAEEMPAGYDTGNEELLVPFPDAEQVYGFYLRAMIALNNFETARYNQHIAMFDSAYGRFRDFCLRRGGFSGGGHFRI